MDADLETARGQKRLDEYIAAYYSGGRKFNPMSWQGMAIVTSKPRIEQLKKIAVPTLIIHGDQDEVIDYPNGEALADIIPNAKLITLKGAHHCFTILEIYDDEYIPDIVKHMQGN